MQLVVVMAVRKAVSAATITFTATSTIPGFEVWPPSRAARSRPLRSSSSMQNSASRRNKEPLAIYRVALIRMPEIVHKFNISTFQQFNKTHFQTSLFYLYNIL